MERPILSYYDVDIYPRDVALFGPRKWVNDTCITFCMKRCQHNSTCPSDVRLLEASVVSYLSFQIEDEDEMNDLRSSIPLESTTWLVLPVNDSGSLGESGSHWSLLTYHVPSGVSFHLDSHAPHNTASSKLVAEKVSWLSKRYVAWCATSG